MSSQANVIVGLGNGELAIAAYDAAYGAAVSVGYTIGGVELSFARAYYEKKVDQEIGDIDVIKTSEKATLKLKLAEATLVNLAMAMDYPSTAIAGGTTLTFGGNADVQYLTLYLNVKAPGTGTNRRYTFNKAVCISAATHGYKKDGPTEIECEFNLLQDTSKTADQQIGSIVDTAADVIAPTVALTTPVDGGTVVGSSSAPVVWAITEASTMDESSIIYGDADGGTILIMGGATLGVAVMKAGTIVYSPSLKTITFTPTVAWTNAHVFQAIVTTGLKDISGNHLAATKIEFFSATTP
jgi:hypothetical protein